MASATADGTLDVCCLTEYRALPGTPRGKIIKIAEINSYHVSGSDETSKGKTIVLLTDVFGLTKNPCITADELSEKSGFDVYVPDLFHGDPIPSSFLKSMPDAPGEHMSIGTKLKFTGKILTTIAPWLIRHRQANTLPILEKFFKVCCYTKFFFLSNKYLQSALRTEQGVTRIEAVGYCYGGFYALLSGSAQHQLADAVVGCHVSMASKAQFEQIKVPVAIVCAQEDDQFSDSFRREAEQILARKSDLPNMFLLTNGTVHGFAARPNPDNPVVMKAYKQANDLIVEWAKTHL